MGNFIDKTVLSRFRSHKEYRLLMIGLDAAGKTTILYKMKLGEVVTTIPTIGFNVETVNFKGVNLTAWDVGSRGKIRPLWRHYYQNTQALLFVVDSNDRERLEDAAEEFHRIVAEDELRDTVVMVLANKQDLSNALNVHMIAEAFNLHKVRHTCNIFPVCATSGDGLNDAFDWLAATLQNIELPNQDEAGAETSQGQELVKPSMISSLTKWFKSMLKPV